MSNVLTGLSPVIYKGLNKVAREMVGLIRAVTLDSQIAQAAIGQVVRSPVSLPTSTATITPSNVSPNTGGQSIDWKNLTMTKSKAASIQWSGEEQKFVGTMYESILVDQFAEAFRTITNEVEADLAAEAVATSSRAYGSAGTAPFGTANDLTDAAGIQQILDENGAPVTDRRLIVSHATNFNFRGKQTNLFKVNEAGTEDLLRKGLINDLSGLGIGVSDALGKALHTKGTGASYVTNGTYAVGDGQAYDSGNATSVPINVDGGTGTILAGDVVTFTGDTNKYIVTADAVAGNVYIAAPGLKKALADGVNMTIGNSYTPNIALHKAAIVLATREPYMPAGGDAAVDVMSVTDPVSKLTFQVVAYRQYRQLHIEIGLVWGKKNFKSEFSAILLG